jgi:hypothetical protein
MKYYTVIRDLGDGSHDNLNFRTWEEAMEFYNLCESKGYGRFEYPETVDTDAEGFFLTPDQFEEEVEDGW